MTDATEVTTEITVQGYWDKCLVVAHSLFPNQAGQNAFVIVTMAGVLAAFYDDMTKTSLGKEEFERQYQETQEKLRKKHTDEGAKE